MSVKLGFIGSGNMAEAILASIIEKDFITSTNIYISDPDEARCEYIKNKYQINISPSNDKTVESSDAVILAVKPQMMNAVLEQTFGNLKQRAEKLIIISIAAGITTKTIEDLIYKDLTPEQQVNIPVIRVMPNTPALAGKGMSGISGGAFASKDSLEFAQKIMNSMGDSLIFEESKIDAVTAISGSGPAYFFYFIETLVNAATKLGFSENEAQKLVFQTAEGSLALMKKTGENPSILRKKVTSKGGTTEAAINEFINNDFQEIINSVTKKAYERSIELSKG